MQGPMAVLIIMPERGQFEILAQGLADAMRLIDSALSATEVALALPKCEVGGTLETSHREAELRDILAGMAITRASEKGVADLSAILRQFGAQDILGPLADMAPSPQWQAATAITSQVVSEVAQIGPVELRINRPFIFFIRDTSSGLILFTGRVRESKDACLRSVNDGYRGCKMAVDSMNTALGKKE